jgi:ATP-binding cassette subfamily B (MDR/TAP) protein 1
MCPSPYVPGLHPSGRFSSHVYNTQFHRFKRVVILKDQVNKKAHADSAQVACEAAGAIRTVASLTREDDCLEYYSKSLEEPLRRSNRTALWSNLMFSLSQSFSFFVIALVFWYGSRLVSFQEFTTKQFFTGLMVS